MVAPRPVVIGRENSNQHPIPFVCFAPNHLPNFEWMLFNRSAFGYFCYALSLKPEFKTNFL